MARDLVRIEELLSFNYLFVHGKVNEVGCLVSAYIESKTGNADVPLVMTKGMSRIERTRWRNCEEFW
jgi:hypothetical protein